MSQIDLIGLVINLSLLLLKLMHMLLQVELLHAMIYKILTAILINSLTNDGLMVEVLRHGSLVSELLILNA